MELITRQIKEQALKIGFHLVGIAPAEPHTDVSFFKEWLLKGFQAEMRWLDRSLEKREDPQRVLKGAQSLVMCGLSYHRGHPRSCESFQEGHGWISNYAWGEDYHNVMPPLLEELKAFIHTLCPGHESKIYVDTGPVLERSYAAWAGLGWIGKNTCLINKKWGSLFFIGEVLTTAPLLADAPGLSHCGHCRRCLDICPTQALTPYELDSAKCLSYLTIEHRGDFSQKLENYIPPHIYGCDLCQDVCPWNRKSLLSDRMEFDPRPGFFNPQLETIQLDDEGFRTQFRKSPIKRTKVLGMRRNVALAQKGIKQKKQ